MKKKISYLFFAMFSFMSSCMAQNLVKVSGDWNGDGQKEVASIKRDVDRYQETESPDIVRFSKSGIPAINTNAFYCELQNLGDLNGDGHDELGIIKCGLSSVWGSYVIYSFKNGKWVVSTKFSIQLDETPGVYVKKISKGKIRITYCEIGESYRTKVITIK